MFSGVPPITDMRRWPCRYQTFYLKPFMRRCGGHSRRQLLANAAIAALRRRLSRAGADTHQYRKSAPTMITSTTSTEIASDAHIHQAP